MEQAEIEPVLATTFTEASGIPSNAPVANREQSGSNPNNEIRGDGISAGVPCIIIRQVWAKSGGGNLNQGWRNGWPTVSI